MNRVLTSRNVALLGGYVIPIFSESEREKFLLLRELLGELVFIAAVWISAGLLHLVVKKVLEYTYLVYSMPEPVQTILSSIGSVAIVSTAVGYSIVAIVKTIRMVKLCVEVMGRRS